MAHSAATRSARWNILGGLAPRTSRLPASSRLLPPRRPLTGPTLMAADPAAVAALVEKAGGATGSETAPVKVAKAVKKPTGALTVSVEYSDPEGAAQPNGVDFRTLSMNIRRDKGSVVLCDVSTDRGMDDCEAFVKEQVQWKGKFPGPVPVVASGKINGIETIAKAKAVGADGVYLPVSDAGLIKGCHAMGIEAIIECSESAHVKEALDAGAKIIAIYTGEDVEKAKSLREEVPKECVALVAINGRGYGGPQALFELDESVNEDEDFVAPILQAGFALREVKWNGMIVKGACVNADQKEECSYARWLIAQLASKMSTKYSKIAKISSPLGTGRPPQGPGGFISVLEGSKSGSSFRK
mmetsp:Transcript_56572/g.138859  ORF Transcript_56572/g.138859 Transcript_56572/m.138859 type:complete len:356 (-) Transcript_56572:98-1165(-)